MAFTRFYLRRHPHYIRRHNPASRLDSVLMALLFSGFLLWFVAIGLIQ